MDRSKLLILLGLLIFGCGAGAPRSPSDVARADSLTRTPADSISQSRQNAITRAVAAASPAVVSINVIELQRIQVRDPFYDFFSDPFFEQFFGRRRYQEYERTVKGLGSGFVLSPDGYIVTNDHVAGRATKITVSFGGGLTREAELIGTDEATDLALLKVEAEEPLPYLEFADGPVLVGEWAIALGNPFGLFEATEPSVTVGVVSAAGRDFELQDRHIYLDMIQTDAAINQGNSGGPLVNAEGKVIGVNTFIYTQRGGGSIGLGFAVPAERASRIVQELKEEGFIDRSYFTGLSGTDVDPRIASALGLDRPEGVFIEEVLPNSPADEAGFEAYDVIVRMDGEPVEDRSDFVALLYNDYRPGDRVSFEVVRDGEIRRIDMRIGRAQ
jgi:serine protease Do